MVVIEVLLTQLAFLLHDKNVIRSNSLFLSNAYKAYHTFTLYRAKNGGCSVRYILKVYPEQTPKKCVVLHSVFTM